MEETILAEPLTEFTAEVQVTIGDGVLFLVPVPWNGIRRFRIGITGPDGDGGLENLPPTG